MASFARSRARISSWFPDPNAEGATSCTTGPDGNAEAPKTGSTETGTAGAGAGAECFLSPPLKRLIRSVLNSPVGEVPGAAPGFTIPKADVAPKTCSAASFSGAPCRLAGSPGFHFSSLPISNLQLPPVHAPFVTTQD